MDYRIGLRQVSYEMEREVEGKFWEKWLTIYPRMTEENFISFEEFKEMHKPQEKLNESEKARIDRMVEDIRGKVVKT